MKFIQPSVEVFNIRIDEPITTVTDLLLAAISFYAYYRISSQETDGRMKTYFRYYFLTLGLGALFGGLLGHAFLYNLGPGWKLVSWIFVLASVGIISHALIDLSRPLIRPQVSRLVALTNGIIIFIALLYTLLTLGFSAVQYYTIFGMVVIVGSLSYLIRQKTGNRGVSKFMLAIGVGIFSALVFSFELGLGPWLTHSDISHLILSYATLVIYKGAVLILETPASLF